MTNPKGRLDTILDGCGIRLVPVWRPRKTGQSHARGAMKMIVRDHGEDHLILTLRIIRESKGNAEALWSEVICAVSDILLARPDWQDSPSELFAAFDTLDLNTMREEAVRLRPWPIRQTLRAWLYAELGRLVDGRNSRREWGIQHDC